MTMRRSFTLFWGGIIGLGLIATGCGRDPFVPSRRPKALPTTAEVERSKPTFLVYVVPGEPTPEQQLCGIRAQQMANIKRAIFRVMGPGPGDSGASQAEIVRKAVADGASGLLVYPGDSPDLAKAVAEAEAKGIPVVLIGKTLPPPEGSRPFTVVDLGSFDASAKEIVKATLDDLAKAKQPTDGTALITVDKVSDLSSARRVAALQAAAEAAKFRQVVMVPYDSTDPESARKAILDAVKAHPDVSVVLADETEGLWGAANARIESKAKPIFFVGGYADFRHSTKLQQPQRESCYVEGQFDELGSKAVQVALARLQGEPFDNLVVLNPKFMRTEGQVWSEGETLTPALKTTQGEAGAKPPSEPTDPKKPQ